VTSGRLAHRAPSWSVRAGTQALPVLLAREVTLVLRAFKAQVVQVPPDRLVLVVPLARKVSRETQVRRAQHSLARPVRLAIPVTPVCKAKRDRQVKPAR
jgi:hypothetical protein